MNIDLQGGRVETLLTSERHFRHIKNVPLARLRILEDMSYPSMALYFASQYGLTCPGCQKIYFTDEHWWHFEGRYFRSLFNQPDLFKTEVAVCEACASEFRDWQDKHILRRIDWSDDLELSNQFLYFTLLKLL